MIERCEFDGCTVQRDSESKGCQETLYYFDSASPSRSLCAKHFELCERALHEIPTAVMEFHAWALLHTPHKAVTQCASLQAAEDRVVRLRAIEAWLHGGAWR
jgi:hypothetical protein